MHKLSQELMHALIQKLMHALILSIKFEKVPSKHAEHMWKELMCALSIHNTSGTYACTEHTHKEHMRMLCIHIRN
jgi:hypothetical protein